MVTVGIIFAALQIVIYVVHNRRVAKGRRPKDGSEPQIYVLETIWNKANRQKY